MWLSTEAMEERSRISERLVRSEIELRELSKKNNRSMREVLRDEGYSYEEIEHLVSIHEEMLRREKEEDKMKMKKKGYSDEEIEYFEHISKVLDKRISEKKKGWF